MAAMAGDGDTKLDMYHDVAYTVDPQHVEGEMTVGPKEKSTSLGQLEFNTLDEPIRDTILRDVRAVGKKFLYVLYFKEKKSLLKEWDLWGPLVLCTFLATILQSSSDATHSNDGGPEFAEVFVIVWIGSIVVTLNSKLLGGNISFFQSVCVLGYCLLPLAIALIFCVIILTMEQTPLLLACRLIITIAGYFWANYASKAFLRDSTPAGRRGLVDYPIVLFYMFISWLIVCHI